MTEIRTERLLLRRATIDDLEAMHQVLRNPEAMRYWSTGPHASLEDTRDWLTAMISAPPEESDDFVMTFEGKVIGKVGCFHVPGIGFILHPDYWGKGLAQEAMRAIIPRVFARFAVPALVADVDPRNTASLNLLSRLGFVETSRASCTWNVGGEWCDSVYMSLPRPPAHAP